MSFSITVDVSDAIRALQTLESEFDEAVEEALSEYEQEFVNQIKGNIQAQGLVETGRMRDSVSAEVRKSAEGFEGEVSIDVEYATTHEFGAVINSSGDKPLAFQNEDGNWVYSDKVVVPARPFVTPVVENLGDQLEEFIGTRVQKRLVL